MEVKREFVADAAAALCDLAKSAELLTEGLHRLLREQPDVPETSIDSMTPLGQICWDEGHRDDPSMGWDNLFSVAGVARDAIKTTKGMIEWLTRIEESDPPDSAIFFAWGAIRNQARRLRDSFADEDASTIDALEDEIADFEQLVWFAMNYPSAEWRRSRAVDDA